MTFESTGLTSIAVDKGTALVTGTAMVVDTRSGFEGEVQFNAVFADSGRRKQQNDAMSLTLFLPAGTETFSGQITLGDIEAGTHRR